MADPVVHDVDAPGRRARRLDEESLHVFRDGHQRREAAEESIGPSPAGTVAVIELAVHGRHQRDSEQPRGECAIGVGPEFVRVDEPDVSLPDQPAERPQPPEVELAGHRQDARLDPGPLASLPKPTVPEQARHRVVAGGIQAGRQARHDAFRAAGAARARQVQDGRDHVILGEESRAGRVS